MGVRRAMILSGSGRPCQAVTADRLTMDLLLTAPMVSRVIELGPVRGGQVHVGEHVLLGGVHQRGEPRYLGPQLVGYGVPLTVGSRGVLVGIDGADPGRDDAALGLAGMSERVAGEVDPAALPSGAEHLRDRGLQALVGVGVNAD